MAQINDLVELSNGSIGVISDVNPLCRVEFTDNRRDVADDEIANVLEPGIYNVNDEITVWPELGTITAIVGNIVYADVQHSDVVPNLGPVEWVGQHQVPMWRVIRDNDPRINRNDYGNRN